MICCLLRLLNQLKTEARIEFLTSSQASVISELDTYWTFPERVNLVGEVGAGKTFLGWSIARSYHGVFLPNPEALQHNEPEHSGIMIIDNVPEDVTRLRAILAELQLGNNRKALLISRQKNRLGLPTIELKMPTRDDIEKVYHHLSLLECYALEPLTQGNLWQVVFSTLTISHIRKEP